MAEPPKPYPQALDEDLHVFTMYLNVGGWLGLAGLVGEHRGFFSPPVYVDAML